MFAGDGNAVSGRLAGVVPVPGGAAVLKSGPGRLAAIGVR